MARNLVPALAGLLALASPALAQTAQGHIGLSYGAFLGDAVEDADKWQLDTSGTFGITPGVGVQVDGLIARYGESDRTGRMIGIHGVFNLVDDTAFGLYLGRDWVGSDGMGFWGAEYAGEFSGFGVEGYLGGLSDGGEDGYQAGLHGRVAVNAMAGVGLKFDRFDIADTTATRVALTGDVTVGSDFVLTGELGTADSPGGSSEAFVTIGGKLNFGGGDGATFGQRGILTLLPGG